jgi:protein phosphatase
MSEAPSVSAVMRSDTGLVRSHNEDFVAGYEPEDAAATIVHGWFYIVADGVGGADAGEVASQYATEQAVHHYLTTYVAYDWGERVLRAMQEANTDLRRLASERNDKRRMATTMVAAAIHDSTVVIGNVGDSRAYLWRSGELMQITKDQSLVARLVEEGAITADEAATHPHRNIILSSIGSERRPPIDLYERGLEPGDLLLMCSDGLIRHVNDEEICIIVGSRDKVEAADDLVELARDRGGEDNISVSIVQYGPREEQMVVAPMPEPATTLEALAVPAAMAAAVTAPAAVKAPAKTLWPMTLALAMVMAGLLLLIWYAVQLGTAV